MVPSAVPQHMNEAPRDDEHTDRLSKPRRSGGKVAKDDAVDGLKPDLSGQTSSWFTTLKFRQSSTHPSSPQDAKEEPLPGSAQSPNT